MAIVLPRPISEVKKNLNRVVAEVAESGAPVVIGNHSEPVAAIISWEQYLELVGEREEAARR